MWTSSNWLGRQKLDPMWRVLNQEVDLGEPTSFLDHVHLGCIQRQCEIIKDIVDNYRTMFWISILSGRSGDTTISSKSSYFFMVLWFGRSCKEHVWSDIVSRPNRPMQPFYKESLPCIDDHHFKEEIKSVGELSHVCSQIVLKCWYLARIGRLDIQWSVNKLARSITKWTKACDKRLNRLISYFHHIGEYKQYCHVGNTAKQCRLGLFQDCLRGGSWRFEIFFRRNIMCFRKSYVFSNKLDVHETNVSFSQLNRIWNHLVGH